MYAQTYRGRILFSSNTGQAWLMEPTQFGDPLKGPVLVLTMSGITMCDGSCDPNISLCLKRWGRFGYEWATESDTIVGACRFRAAVSLSRGIAGSIQNSNAPCFDVHVIRTANPRNVTVFSYLRMWNEDQPLYDCFNQPLVLDNQSHCGTFRGVANAQGGFGGTCSLSIAGCDCP